MCGVMAILRSDPRTILCPELVESLKRLKHRGPDASGITHMKIAGGSLSLGMTRLKIVDLRNLTVPFHFPYLKTHLAYNGEIYNLQELKEELSDGTPWLTRNDAEVLVRAWKRWGVDCLQHFNGMWAFILADQAQQKIFISRDRTGKKPLYIHNDGSEIVYFSSEVQALPIPLQPAPCADMEALEFDIGPISPMLHVRQLPPGSLLCISSSRDLHEFMHGQRGVQTWWDLPSVGSTDDRSLASSVDEAEALIIDAVRIRAVSEVPLAVSLSGGLDSAIIQAVVRSQNCYCVTFDEIDNISEAERSYSKTKSVSFSFEDMQEAMPDVLRHLGTPATWSAVALWFMNKAMKQDGIKVALSGEGADEAFAGYARYIILYHLDQMKTDARLLNYGPTIEHMLQGDDLKLLVRMLCRGNSKRAIDRSKELIVPGVSLLDTMQRTDLKTTMQVLLRMADRMSMAHSIETRNPFLDHRLIELGLRLPLSQRIDKTETKTILRAVARRLQVHPAIVEQKTKRGLSIPWKSWQGKLLLGPQGSAGSRGIWDRSAFAGWCQRLFVEQCRSHQGCQNHTECHRTTSVQSSR